MVRFPQCPPPSGLGLVQGPWAEPAAGLEPPGTGPGTESGLRTRHSAAFATLGHGRGHHEPAPQIQRSSSPYQAGCGWTSYTKTGTPVVSPQSYSTKLHKRPNVTLWYDMMNKQLLQHSKWNYLIYNPRRAMTRWRNWCWDVYRTYPAYKLLVTETSCVPPMSGVNVSLTYQHSVTDRENSTGNI